MKMTKIVGSTALAMLLLSGCGSSDSATTANGASTTPVVETTPAAKAVTLSEFSAIGNQAASLSTLSLVVAEDARTAGARQGVVRDTIDSLIAKVKEMVAAKAATYKNDFNQLKVDLVTNPSDVNGTAAQTAVAKVANALVGRTIKGNVITQEQVDAFLAKIDAGGLYFISMMQAYADFKNGQTADTIADDTTGQLSAAVARRGLLSDFDDLISGVTDPITDALLDPVKDGLVDIIALDPVTDLTADAFKLVLQSGSITTLMLDMAIDSETITDIMVEVMVDNWDLTEPMIPMMLDPENDYEFTRKFLQLAVAHHQQIGTMTFSYINLPLYDAITKVMAVSPKVNSMMGETMVLIGANHFVKPDASHTIVRADQPALYAGTDAFARLMLDPANGIVNERMFYSLFAKSDTTAAFVKTMQQVKNNDATVSTFFMDNIFLGGELDAVATLDDAHKDQAMKNIYAVAKAMLDGNKIEGVSAYSASFIGFAGLVPFDRYVPYGKAFGTAGYFYAKANGLSIPGGTIGNWLANTFFNDGSAEAVEASTAPARQALSITALTDLIANLKDFFLGAFDSLGSVTDFITNNSIGQAIGKAFDALLQSGTVAVDAFVAELTLKAHDQIETKIQVIIKDANYTLPPFDNLSLNYITTVAKTTAKGIMDDPATIRQFTENARVQEVYAYVNTKLETNTILGYIPNWMTKLDYLELPANIDAKPKPIINFKSGSADIYILSDNADIIDLQVNVLGNTVLLSEVALEDSPLTVKDGEIAEMHVYKFTVSALDLVNINGIMAKIGEYLENRFGVVAVDASDAIVEDTTTTTTETTTTEDNSAA